MPSAVNHVLYNIVTAYNQLESGRARAEGRKPVLHITDLSRVEAEWDRLTGLLTPKKVEIGARRRPILTPKKIKIGVKLESNI